MHDTAISTGPPPETPPASPAAPQPPALQTRKKNFWYQLLEALASLRLTVVLFSLSFLLVFYGTWAQKEMGLWTAVDRYFHSCCVWIPLRIVLCHTFPDIPGAILFPGGWLLGTLLMINLLAAHAMRFQFTWKRSGILLTHSGLVLMMLGELIYAGFAVEGHMRIEQGASANYLEHERYPELAIVDSSDPSKDVVVAIPEGRLRGGEPIADEKLPFTLEVSQYLVNSVLASPEKDANNPATAGIGLDLLAEAKPEVSGAGGDQAADAASAYVTFQPKDNGQSLGTFLVSTAVKVPQQVAVDGKTYLVSLRAKRSYKPYTFHLLEFRHDLYPGTNTPKNFSSLVRLVDPTTGEDREVKISMNDPLRYHGETFYQSGYLPNDAGTILQVVGNPGWLLPYASCIIVTLGLLIHFGLRLDDFLWRIAA